MQRTCLRSPAGIRILQVRRICGTGTGRYGLRRRRLTHLPSPRAPAVPAPCRLVTAPSYAPAQYEATAPRARTSSPPSPGGLARRMPPAASRHRAAATTRSRCQDAWAARRLRDGRRAASPGGWWPPAAASSQWRPGRTSLLGQHHDGPKRVSANTTIEMPAQVAGLPKIHSSQADQVNRIISGSAMPKPSLIGFYGTSAQSPTAFMMVAKFPQTADQVEHNLSTSLRALDESVGNVVFWHTVDAGPLGGQMRCATITQNAQRRHRLHVRGHRRHRPHVQPRHGRRAGS